MSNDKSVRDRPVNGRDAGGPGSDAMKRGLTGCAPLIVVAVVIIEEVIRSLLV